ncbi:MAG: HAMP domain-containing histidine kinase [Lachnospiraceae bacterium]|nr:HAMP domain-containing histidine kinase [Lachnospiraceae bacterium]
MSENEIIRIRRKFILVSTLSFFGVMLLMGLFIYLFSSVTLGNEVRQILDYIIENDGELPEKRFMMRDTIKSDERDFRANLEYIFGTGDLFGISQDYLYTTRFFAVIYDAEGNVSEIKTGHIAGIDTEKALEYADKALAGYFTYGNTDRYYYKVADREDGGKIVVYLDRFSQMYTIRRIMFSAMLLVAVGTLLAFLLMRVLSEHVVRSEVRNIEKQKQFITNAGHELKTPLAIIRANTEMQEVIAGESEWTQSIMRQVDRMNGLIQNLVRIAKAQETGGGPLSDINISPYVEDAANSFKPVAVGEGKSLDTEIEENIVLKSDEGKIRQLVSLLVDNAVKYCDDGGNIRVRLSRSGKNVLLEVLNSYAEGGSVDYSRFFERFYREDRARTIGNPGEECGKTENNGDRNEKNGMEYGNPGSPAKQRSGYGIGLSIASELVNSLKGRIGASWKDGKICCTCRFPVKN